MTWATAESPSEEVALERAADALNKVLDRRVPVSVQMRVTACVHDALSFMTLLRQLETDEIGRSEKQVNGVPPWDSKMSFQFAAGLKAMYYFVRALHDAVYAALLEAAGQHAGAYSSMQSCATKAGNPIRPLIRQALPDYFDWFADFRDVRNNLKLGASTAFGFRGAIGSTQVRVILQNVDNAKRDVSGGRELSLADIDLCLTHSARLLQFAADHIRHSARA